MSELNLAAVAVVRSCYKDCFGTPRQGMLAPSSEAWIDLLPSYQGQGFLTGLSDFSHLWLIAYFHRNDSISVRGRVRPPRLGGGKIGVFASRSPHRPSPIGLTLVQILEVREDSLRVGGIDLIEGTPILDLKPYLAEADRVDGAKSGWTEGLETQSFAVDFSPEVTERMAKLNLPIPQNQFINLIEESLRLDPRPTTQRNQDKTFFFQVYDWDVGFIWRPEGPFVSELRPARCL